MKEDELSLMGLNENTVREMERDQEEAAKWAGELPTAGIERLEAIRQAAGEMAERTETRTKMLGKVIDECREGNPHILKQLARWALAGAGGLLGGLLGGAAYMGFPTTGGIEMRAVKKLFEQLRKLLNTDKELSVRLCSLLKETDRLINQKLEENEQKKNKRLEAEKKAAEEERKELERAKRNCSWT
ncbi:MAG: hypothetical protein Q4F50_08385 [Bacteroides sp.]|uniref:hypothetical protein n=1 Tax=Bacteroides sp. TaxID=29523 RepID=UPI0026E0D5F5|nr:hypothetical protein [Bacteroides sp.]MDO5420061.1 hypothetical protein [Bacteroides sp.]